MMVIQGPVLLYGDKHPENFITIILNKDMEAFIHHEKLFCYNSIFRLKLFPSGGMS